MEPISVLIADSRPGVRASLRGRLDGPGVSVSITECDGGFCALDTLIGNEFDCAFLADDLGELPGREVLAELRRAGRATPVVLLSDELRLAEALQLGAHDCLPPDAHAEALVRAAGTAARVARAERRAFAAESRRSHQSMFDTVTSLPNSALFYDRLEQAVALARRTATTAAVVVLTVEGLAQVSASHGGAAGAELLRLAAARMRAAARGSDTIARIGDAVFAVALAPDGTVGAATAARKILDAVRRPVAIAGDSLALSAHGGLAVFPEHGSTGAELLRHADLAMRRARRALAGLTVYSGDEPGAEDLRPVALPPISADLKRATAAGELSLLFQPKLRIAPLGLSGVEALVRWNHPVHGMVTPDSFIPLAEQTGEIAALTEWVLDSALTAAAGWREAGHPVAVAVNVSALAVHDTALVETVSKALDRTGLPPALLTLEITESALMADVDRARDVLAQIRARGVRIAVDDFGAGYTSLSAIGRLPVDELKVDKSFVRGLGGVSNNGPILRAIIELGQSLGLKVVAEGVEDRDVWDALAALRCDEAQGFFLCRPLTAEALLAWVRYKRWTALFAEPTEAQR